MHTLTREMSYCNLASINLVNFYESDDDGKTRLAETAVKILDKTVTNNDVYDGKNTTDTGRYIGVGILNLATLLAKKHIKYGSQESLEFVDKLLDDLSYRVYSASVELAKKLGPCKAFENTDWAIGETPVSKSFRYYPNVWQLTEYGKNFKSSGRFDRWKDLADQITKYGIRNAQCMAIAPTARSGKVIGASEGREPIFELEYLDDNDRSYVTRAPMFSTLADEYVTAFNVDQYRLIELAAICQKYIDQSQSVTLYTNEKSLRRVSDLHLYAYSLGIKTLYYYKVQKTATEDECSACVI